jgi:hypothetical protein
MSRLSDGMSLDEFLADAQPSVQSTESLTERGCSHGHIATLYNAAITAAGIKRSEVTQALRKLGVHALLAWSFFSRK